MKQLSVVLITQGVSRIVSPLLDSQYNILGVIECAPRVYSTDWSSKIKRRLRKLTGSPSLADFVKSRRIPYFFMSRENHPELKTWLNNLKPDVMIVYSMSQLLASEIFRIPEYGTLNLHPSALPSYRGPNPWFWMYYHQEQVGGVTLHYVDEGEDTGDIIYQELYDFPLGAKSPAMHDLAIGEIGSRLILKALETLDKGDSLPRHTQPENSPTQRARNIKRSEHDSIIDWSHWPVERIWHLLRGTESWLNAISPPTGIFSGQRWQILHYEKSVSDNSERDDNLGAVISDKSAAYVQCRDGKIFLKVSFTLRRFLRFFLLKIF